jgi:hypothetical protein
MGGMLTSRSLMIQPTMLSPDCWRMLFNASGVDVATAFDLSILAKTKLTSCEIIEKKERKKKITKLIKVSNYCAYFQGARKKREKTISNSAFGLVFSLCSFHKFFCSATIHMI